MNTKNKLTMIISFVIILLGVFILLTPEVYAETEYDVWVSGQRFDENTLSIDCDEGTAVFDPTSNTLTLNNVVITQTYEWQPYYEGAIYSALPTLNIVVNGNCFIRPSSSYGDGIDVSGGCNVVISGNGVLNFEGGYYGAYVGSWDIDGSDLIIQNGVTVNVVNTQAAGLWVNHNIEVLNAKLNILRESENYSGLVSNKDGTIRINNSIVKITTATQTIHFGNGDTSNHSLLIESGTVNLTSTKEGAYVIYVQPVLDTNFDPTDELYGNLTMNSGKLQLNVPAQGTGINIAAEDISLSEGVVYTKGSSFKHSGSDEEGVTIIAESNPFPDVPTGKWFTDGIRYVKDLGLMGGYTSGANAGNFGTNDKISRGQVVTILYRAAGEPDIAGYDNPFTDVPEGKYYTNAIKWAFHYGITTGKTATSFDPNGNVTRQELAVFMARYAKSILGKDTDSTYNITEIADYSDLSTWAIEPMKYIMEKGIITGDMALGYPRILPRENASRAHAATMLMRFCQSVLDM